MLNVSDNTLNVNLHDENPSEILGSAEVVPMPEGDLVISLRRPGAHPDVEVAIVTVAVQADGSFRVLVMDGETTELGQVTVS